MKGDWPDVSARTGLSRGRREYMVYIALYMWALAWGACYVDAYNESGRCVRPNKVNSFPITADFF